MQAAVCFAHVLDYHPAISSTTFPMHIRIATPDDISAMQRIRLAVVENRLTRSVITEADYMKAIVETGRGWVAEVHDVTRGFAVGNRDTGNIWALFVEPGFEGRGIGRALHDAMLDWLQSQACARIWLTTEPGTRAERFYRRAGWRFEEIDASGDAAFVWSR